MRISYSVLIIHHDSLLMVISFAQFQLFILALTRVLALIIHVPVLGGQAIPNAVKIGLGALLAMVLLPWQPLPPDAPSMATLEFGLAIGRELLIGTLAGFAAVLTFAVFQIAANLMGLGSGFGAGSLLNPALENTGTAMDQMFVMMTVLLFIVLNGHHVFLQGLQQTFELLPLNGGWPLLSSDRLLRLGAGMIAAGVQMSLPVLGTVLLADLTLGLLARVAPQVHVFFLGVPLKVGVGLLALALSLTVLFPVIAALFSNLSRRMLELLGA